MAKLFSGHDKYHLHAVLGLLALLHFVYRFFTVLILQQESFQQNSFSAACLLVHVLLHALSFQFELPRNRIWTKPMIWREFRVYNALFAMRHLIGTALGIWAPDWWLRQPGVAAVAAKVCLVLATCKAADITTEQIGSTDDRTTNAMPYPKKTPETLEKVAKRFYAKSQFAATALAAFGTPSSSFCAIFAIEIASFLMTLVRKGIIEARTYHVLYAASLFIMFPVLVATLHSGDAVAEAATLRCLFIGALGIDIRIKYGFSKYTAWLVAIPAGYILADTLSMYANMKLFFAWPGMMWSASDTLRGFFQARQQSNDFTAAPEGEVSKEILNESPVTQSQAAEGLEGSSAKEADAAGHSFPYVTPSLG